MEKNLKKSLFMYIQMNHFAIHLLPLLLLSHVSRVQLCATP